MYLSHKQTVVAVLADTARVRVTEGEAEKIVHVGLMLRKYILLQQMSFTCGVYQKRRWLWRAGHSPRHR